jgi:hypothetical protein
MVMIIFGLTHFFSIIIIISFFFQFAMAHSVNTANTTCFFKEVQQATNRFTATYFALHALQKSILLAEKAVVIFIHWVSTICEKELNTYK